MILRSAHRRHDAIQANKYVFDLAEVKSVKIVPSARGGFVAVWGRRDVSMGFVGGGMGRNTSGGSSFAPIKYGWEVLRLKKNM